jgi:hypothetical protein
MRIEWIFPVALIVLDIAAAAVYMSKRDYYMCGYWICAAGITSCATFRG